jgi:hypothetical protein
MVPYLHTNRCCNLKNVGEHIALIVCMLIIVWFSACKPKHICPAYQSAFYLDKKVADLEFTPFDQDSMPKMEATVRKTDVLLVLRLGKKKIDKRMAVIPMITIFPETADSAMAMADSLAADSAANEEEEGINPEELTDSTSKETENLNPNEPIADEPEAVEKKEDDFGDVPKEVQEKPKTIKKQDLKDPELSDPTMKAEFEESFEDAPKEEDLNEPMPAFEEPPQQEPKKKKPAKKGPKKEIPLKPSEKEPEPEEDKF